MSGELSAKQLAKELKELTEFLAFPNPQLRLQAARVCAGLSAGSAVTAHGEVIEKSALVQALTGRLSDTNDIRKEALMALVNLSEHEPFRKQMVEVKAVNALLQALRNAQDPHHELVLMLLSNLSADPKAAGQVMGDEPADPATGKPAKSGAGVELMRLVRLFSVAPVGPAAEVTAASAANGKEKDAYQYIANVLTNLTQTESARAVLLDAKLGLLPLLVTQLGSANEVRRLGTLRALRNLCFDRDKTEAIIGDEKVLAPILAPLCGPEPIDAEDKAKMYPAVRALLTKTKARDPSSAVCRAALELLMLCVHHKPTRLVMKRIGVYYIVREYHNTVRETEPDLDEFLEELVPFLLLDEAPEPKALPALEAPAPFHVGTNAAAADTKAADAKTPAPAAAAAAAPDTKSAAPAPAPSAAAAMDAAAAAAKAKEDAELQALMEARKQRDTRVQAGEKPTDFLLKAKKTDGAAAAAAPAPAPVVVKPTAVPDAAAATAKPKDLVTAAALAMAEESDVPDLVDED